MKSIEEFTNTLNNLDWENISSWPKQIKILAFAVAFIAAIGLGYQFYLSGILDNLERARQNEKKLITDFETKSYESSNLGSYRNQMEELDTAFGALLRQLPSDTEVPGLLEDISHSGVTSGLTIEEIDLGEERSANFYSELPIHLIISGGYHGLATFVSAVSALPRIVTLHDFEISKNKKGRPGELSMRVEARTYRYSSDAKEKKKGER